MKLVFKYDVGQGPQLITIGPAAMTFYERANKTKMSNLAQGIGMSDMCDLIWRQRKLEGAEDGPLDDFVARLLDVDPVGEEDPT